MKSFLRPSLAAIALAAAATSHAQVAVQNAWVRATVPTQKATGAFMQLTAPTDTRLVAASSPLTPHVQVHEMKMEGDIMKMRQVPAVALPAGKTVELAPGAYHLMLLDLPRPVTAGQTVPLTLTFEDASDRREQVEVQAEVKPLNTGAAGMPAGHRAGGH